MKDWKGWKTMVAQDKGRYLSPMDFVSQNERSSTEVF